MATLGMIEYQDASAKVRSIYDDIMITRGTLAIRPGTRWVPSRSPFALTAISAQRELAGLFGHNWH